ncbi:hypothetical protein [Pelagibacterium luteolum]|uniref:Uncharacterized protein n=1 Tax=Pelagibacterium luteolum TaxID=440168 RepID=A0A1G7UXJ3_9HYPH|nr:hypothetical protein [Pelagibacterium luteolum]SDG52184.1 hypothetical protein SAMN04487974_103338 [Pelagibacterium luteolum]
MRLPLAPSASKIIAFPHAIPTRLGSDFDHAQYPRLARALAPLAPVLTPLALAPTLHP